MGDPEHDPQDDEIEDLDAEVVEDLDVDDDAVDIKGGTMGCPTMTL